MILDARTSTRRTPLEEGEVHGEKSDEEEEEAEEEVFESWKLKIDKIHAKYERPFLDKCIYRGEGNANVVLALPSDRKVIRLRKTSPGSPASPDGGRARIIREIEFLEYVVSSFLGEYVQPPEPLRVNRDDMIRVSQAIRHLRPEHRLGKEIIEDYVTVFMDYAFLPLKMTLPLRNNCQRRATFCIEIKPKQGFRHEMDDKFKKCTYCLTQYYKLKNGAVKSRSSYCPHDLFSGDKERMKKSLRGLLESPQNNFKIFKDGVVVFDLNSQRLYDTENILAEWFSAAGPQTAEENFENFFKLVSTALLREFSFPKSNIRRPKSRSLGSSFEDLQPRRRIDPEIIFNAEKILLLSKEECNFAANNLPQGSVLGRILNMQQLPYLSADLVFKVYSKHFTTLNDNAVYSQMIRSYRGENKAAAVSNGMKKDFRAPLKSTIPDNNCNESNGTKEDMRNNNKNNNGKSGERTEERRGSITTQELEILQNYLLATMAKDCSILMAFQEIDPSVSEIPTDFVIEVKRGVNFMVNIGVLDLDPKSISCIEKHRQRDTNVLLSLINAVEEELDLGK